MKARQKDDISYQVVRSRRATSRLRSRGRAVRHFLLDVKVIGFEMEESDQGKK